MTSKYHKLNYREIAYQLGLMFVLFVFFSYQQEEYKENVSITSWIAGYKFAFFGHYMAAATIINYIFLPRLYYQKRRILFALAVVILIALVIIIDEYVLEQIYFPTTRGTHFPGILFTLIETLPTIIIMVAFKFVWDFNKKQSEIEKLKTLVKDSELQFLKNQINHHFLFNSLNNLYSYAIDNSPKTPEIILQLSSVLRYMLYDCQSNYVPLSRELDHLRNYTALNELQIEQRGTVCFNEKIASGKFDISPLVLVVFIENAFKYSTESQSKNILIGIEIEVSENGLLMFSCINNFLPGYTSNKHAGIGLENVRKRLALLYPNCHSLDIKNEDNMYKVVLAMKLKPVEA